MPQYIYKSNKRPNDNTHTLNLKGGKSVSLGGTVDLKKEEVEALSSKFEFVLSSEVDSDEKVTIKKSSKKSKEEEVADDFETFSDAGGPTEQGKTQTYQYGRAESGSDTGVINPGSPSTGSVT